MTATPVSPARAPGRRNPALAAWRRARAVQLACQGRRYDDIAREIGIANRGTVHRMVHQALDRRLAQDVDEYRALSLARLETLLQAQWPQAESGDPRACMALIRVIEAEARLLGLCGGHAGEPGSPRPTTLVMRPDELSGARS